jgi:predicted oxidoreductase
MNNIELGRSGLLVPRVAVGLFRIQESESKEVIALLETALNNGVNFFDHADIYGGGVCESKFGEAYEAMGGKREDIMLQSKCGIIPGKAFDFSKAHILETVEGSLRRLKTDYLDVLLLHRPDALVEPEEVAEAFDILFESGKVRHFGVSNQNPMQIELLKKYLRRPLVTNQLKISVTHSPMVREGLHVNMLDEDAIVREGSILDYSRLNDMTIQAWSPVRYHDTIGTFLDNPDFPELNAKLEEVGDRYGASKAAIAIAWILRHPAKMQVITGTTKAARLPDYFKATDVELTRLEWYEILMAAGFELP